MALVLSPWFGRGCGRRSTSRCGFGSPALFTDLVIVKVPLHRRCSNARVVQWAETPEAHVFTLRLPGLKKEDVHIELEDDRVLYISYQQPKEEGAGEASTSGSKEETFKRKFKLPENVDLEQIKAEVTNETLTVTVPKRTVKSVPRKVDVSDDPAATTSTSTS